MRLLIIIFCFFLPLIGITQNFPDEVNELIEKYPSENLVGLSLVENITITISKENEIEITSDFMEEKIYLQENANMYSEEKVDGSFFHEVSNIEASSFVFEKNKYKEFKVSDFKVNDKLNSSIFHDDSKEYSFYFSNLSKGAKTKLSYKTTIKNPRFLHALFFKNYYPIKNLTFTITVDDNIDLDFKYFNFSGFDAKYELVTKKNKKIYTWNLKDVPKSKYEENSPSFYYNIPHVIPVIKSYSIKNTTTPLLETSSDLYKWYFSLSEEIYNNNDTIAELKQLVDSLTQGMNSDTEKLKVIYYWVQEHIKYIAFESGLGGFVPRKASTVFSNRFGDCKDNSSILFEMLKYVGIKSYLTWVGTRRLPYGYSELPSPKVDNHMINTCIIDSNYYYLDATGRFLKLGQNPSFIQGKEVLIGIDSTNHLIKKIPRTQASFNYSSDSLDLELKGMSVFGKCKHYLDGYTKIGLFNQLESINKDETLKKYYRSYAKKGNNKFIINDFQEINKYSYDDPFILIYNFNIDNYLTTSDNHMYINLTLHKDILPEKIKSDRELPIEMEYGFTKKYFYKLSIPENYEVEFLPNNLSFNENELSYTISYKMVDNTIIYEASITCNKLIVKPSEFDVWNSFAKELQNASKELIVFKLKQ